ncbi:MAG TPA: hypothetical protein PK858_04805, partial [Saprospiraceae bacterium]|nr:hypothetical protein [Saprospiraceae bacterium]
MRRLFGTRVHLPLPGGGSSGPVAASVETWAMALALSGLTLYLGYWAERSDFFSLSLAYGAFFALSLWVVRRVAFGQAAERHYLHLGIVLRMLLLFSLPHLSDDYFRFLWDGHLSAAGVHPFSSTPEQWMGEADAPSALMAYLYRQMNSPRYFTVYPPVCQAVFWAAAKISPYGIWGGVVVLKVFLLCCEVGSIRLLGRLAALAPPDAPCPAPSLQRHAALLYALNPLCILEIVGNLHFEGAMIAALLLGLLMLQQERAGAAGVAWAFSVAAKLVPLMFVPIVWAWLGWRRGMAFLGALTSAGVLLFAPLLDMQVWANMSRSMDLYFQKFQFNASLYYFLRALGVMRTGYDRGDIIGPALGLAVVLAVLALAYVALRRRAAFSTLCAALMWASFAHLTCSAVVHPWYVSLLLVLGLLAGWRFPLLWSAAVVLSYS